MTEPPLRPTHLQILAARAQVALHHRTRTRPPAWLLEVAQAEPVAGEPAVDERASVDRPDVPPRRFPARMPPSSRKRRALARLPQRPMQGNDVRDLQRQLVAQGFADNSLVDGVFGEETENAVRRFQAAYDILNDGVAARVSQRVLSYLETNGIDRDHRPSPEQLHLISFIVKTQQGGLVVIDLVSSGHGDTADRAGIIVADLVEQAGHLLEAQLTALTGMQASVISSTDLIAGDATDIAAYANNIRAELVITLSVANRADVGPGCATFYFGPTEDVHSHVGAPLARFVQSEVVRIANAPDRGIHAAHSQLFEKAAAPTVRVEFGNFADRDDRARLLDEDYLTDVATGIAAGIRTFYLLGQTDDPDAVLHLAPTPRTADRT